MITYLYSSRKATIINVCVSIILLISKQLSAQQVTLTGQVADSRNNPIALATINFVGNSVSGTTDDDGLFSIKLPMGFKKGEQLTMRVSKEGYRTSTRLIIISPISIPIRLARILHYNKKAATTLASTGLNAKGKPVENIPNNNTSIDNISPSIFGNNNHIVSGFGNSIGVNGDVNINQERHLLDADKIAMINFINNLKQSKQSTTNCFKMSLTSNSNGTKVALEIEEYLKGLGYTRKGEGYGTSFLSKPLLGISIDINNDCLDIIVGTL